jgi:Ca2+-transporting ATPase
MISAIPDAPEIVAGGLGGGLTSDEARRRLAATGPNEIRRAPPPSRLKMLARQLASPLIWLLLVASAISAVLREIADAIAIAVIVIVNAVVGFLQESRAETALAALRALTAPRARVRRDGHQMVIPAAEVVPGDVLLLEAGDVVAADARVIEAHRLATNEAALTGESFPAEKRVEAAAADAPLAERRDSLFLGTSIATGTGVAQVTATGMATELGRVAHLLASAQRDETPLQERLARVSRTLLVLCLAIVAVTAVVGLLRGRGMLDVFMSAVSLAVAAVPEGLPAVVTIALAIGVQRMSARNVLIRRLPAVETLGSATVICTDKTGTLTTGVMAVRELWGPDHHALVAAAAACCDAELGPDGRTGTGDPTEIALLAAAAERGVTRETIERERPRRHENPFDSDRKRMSILRADGVLYVKGAPELLFPLCVSGTDGADRANVDMAGRGLRVLGVAVGRGTQEPEKEQQLELLGLVGIADPPRSEAIEAVTAARRAGIQTVMITGDHPVTAHAIARELGIVQAGEDVTDRVHARVSPEGKLDIVRAWKTRGDVVAMTGDGVNDAPALREAHIGIAMGKTGTEVTREASDMVLADDNFASIVAAVREGRGIFDNIRKTLVYLLTGNAAELAVMLAAAVAGLPLPLLPLHLLWINLVTDGFPALALVMDPPDADVLGRPPRPPAEPMLGRRQWAGILTAGAMEAVVVLGVFVWALRTRGLSEARALAFDTLVVSELLRSFAARSATRVLAQVGVFTNARLVAVVLASMLVQIGLHQIAGLAHLFELSSLHAADAVVAIALGFVPVTVLELAKLVRGRR